MSDRVLVTLLLCVLLVVDALCSALDFEWMPTHFGGVADTVGLLLIYLSRERRKQ